MSLISPLRQSRPLSPHLLIYKPQWSSGLSILHRITGVGLAVILPLLMIWWLWALAVNEEFYNGLIECLQSPLGKVVVVGSVWAFFYHLLNGLKYLVWGTGRLLSLKEAKTSGLIAFFASIVLAALFYLKVYGVLS